MPQLAEEPRKQRRTSAESLASMLEPSVDSVYSSRMGRVISFHAAWSSASPNRASHSPAPAARKKKPCSAASPSRSCSCALQGQCATGWGATGTPRCCSCRGCSWLLVFGCALLQQMPVGRLHTTVRPIDGLAESLTTEENQSPRSFFPRPEMMYTSFLGSAVSPRRMSNTWASTAYMNHLSVWAQGQGRRGLGLR